MIGGLLRGLVLAVGLVLLAAAAVAVAMGAGPAALPLVLWGVILAAGVAFERWRYKRVRPVAGPGFEPTAERFIDPTSGRVVHVHADPRTGERRYVDG